MHNLTTCDKIGIPLLAVALYAPLKWTLAALAAYLSQLL